MNKKDAKRPSARVGDIVESTSFCGANVKVRLAERCTHVDAFFGNLVDKDDIVKLVKHGVPYNIKLDSPEDISVIVFDFQIVKKVSQNRKRRRKVRKRV